MTIYVGETILITCAATNPTTGAKITDAIGSVEFYAVGANPAKNPADRTVERGAFNMPYDPAVTNKDGTTGAYVAAVDTATWAPGKRMFRVSLAGVYASWEYGTVTLAS